MGIKRRLFLIVSLILGLSMVFGLFVLRHIESQNQYEENTQRVSALLESLSAPVAFSLVQGRVPDLDNLMDQLQERKAAFYLNHVALFDHRGLLLGEQVGVALVHVGDLAQHRLHLLAQLRLLLVHILPRLLCGIP